MISVAFTSEGQTHIDQVLTLIRGNPYPRYRDNGLVAVGIATLAAADTVWSRKRLRGPTPTIHSVRF